jgi:hypothetical protein
LDTRRATGGILKLRELISEHPRQIAFDFRHKFGLSYLEIGKSITWLEAVLLTAGLMNETDSHLQAAKNDWDYPVSREWIIATQIFDLLARVNSKNKPKPYPTPWPDPNVTKIGAKTIQPRKKILEQLDRMNPSKE